MAVEHGYIPVVPPKSNRKNPWSYDTQLYKQRNQVERLFRRIKRFCRIFTRYDKLDVIFFPLSIWLLLLMHLCEHYLEHFPKEAPVRPLRVNHKVLSVAFGGECVLGDPWPDAPLNWKGGLVHV